MINHRFKNTDLIQLLKFMSPDNSFLTKPVCWTLLCFFLQSYCLCLLCSIPPPGKVWITIANFFTASSCPEICKVCYALLVESTLAPVSFSTNSKFLLLHLRKIFQHSFDNWRTIWYLSKTRCLCASLPLCLCSSFSTLTPVSQVSPVLP